MTRKGTVKGSTIELEKPLSSLEGKTVTVNVEAVEDLPLGSPALLLKAMREPPRLEPGDIEEFKRILRENKPAPEEPSGIFDEDEQR